jgi:hypothetical protein
MLFMAGVLLIAAFFGGWFMPTITKCCPSIGTLNIEVDQIIDNYYKACEEGDRNWSVQEETNSRENLGKMKTLTDETFKKFQMAETTKGGTLQGVHSYDILANPLYLESF